MIDMGQSTTQMITQAKHLYQSIGSVYCPAIKTVVVFNRYGYNHLIYDGHGHRRGEQNIKRRLHLLSTALTVVEKSKAVRKKDKATIRVNGKIRKVIYFEICLSLKTNHQKHDVTVVMRKFEIGQPHFYTVRSNYKSQNKTKKP